MKELEALEKYFVNIVLAIKKPTVVLPTLGLSLTLKNDYIMIFLQREYCFLSLKD